MVIHFRLGSTGNLALAALVACAVLAPTCQAQAFKIIYEFTGSPDGGNPYAGLTLDAAGNLYGATYVGGTPGCFANVGCGTIFELTSGSGVWSESVLYPFTGGSDGAAPLDAPTLDPAGNLYGTAELGGVSCGETFGCGVAFELSLGSGGWTETVIHSFQGGTDGYYPIAGLVLDRHGRLYSTTGNGGNQGQGSIYELSKGAGGWKEKTLYGFTWSAAPSAALLPDEAGNLYGTTTSSNTGGGTVFELPHGTRKVTILHTFNGSDGSTPGAGLVFDKAGDLYGTTEGGGRYGKGVVFKLTPGAKGKWKETVLYSFKGGRDGDEPTAAPALDKKGNLYGTTYRGGDSSCDPPSGCGTAFKLTRGAGHWKETVLHRFTGGRDGGEPFFGGLVLDPAGNLYGTATYGGNPGCLDSFGCGVVFEITP